MKKILSVALLAAIGLGSFMGISSRHIQGNANVANATGSYEVTKSKDSYSLAALNEATAFDMVSTSSTVSGKIRFAVFGSTFYYRADVVDTTLNQNDNPYFKITFGSSSFEIDGRYFEGDPIPSKHTTDRAWGRVISSNGFVPQSFRMCISIDYDDTTSTYTMIESYDLGNVALGNTIGITYTHYDSEYDGQDHGWQVSVPGYCQFNQTLTVVKGISNNVIRGANGEAAGLLSDAEWAAAKKFDMAGANNGELRMAIANNNLFVKMTATDSTYVKNADFLGYTVSVGGQTESKQGNFDPWLTNWDGHTADFSNIQQEFGYADGKYTFIRCFGLGDKCKAGYPISIKFVFKDAGATGGWNTGVENSFNATLYMLNTPEEIINQYSCVMNLSFKYSKVDDVFSNVEFRMGFGVSERIAADAVAWGATAYGVVISDGNTTYKAAVGHYDEANGIRYCVISLGDCINNYVRSTTTFSLAPYVVIGGEEIVGENIEHNSVKAMIGVYYGNPTYEALVEDVYNALYSD